MQFQQFAETPKHIIFSPGATRWLSLEACVNRVLEQLTALELYFTSENFEYPTNTQDIQDRNAEEPFNKGLSSVFILCVEYDE